MIADLLFGIRPGYLITEYEPLRRLAVSITKQRDGDYLWIFRVQDMGKITALLGKVPTFTADDTQVFRAYNPLLSQTVPDKSRKKGEGKFEIIHKAPKLLIIETFENKRTVHVRVPTDNVQMLWEVMKGYPLNKAIQSMTVARNVLEKLGITRFHRPNTQTFDEQKFFGARKDYKGYFYYPAKVLQSQEVIRHDPNGLVERIAEHWSIQMLFEEEEEIVI